MPAFDDEARKRLEELNRRLMADVTAPLELHGWPGANEIVQSLAAGFAQDSARWLAMQRGYYEKQLALWHRFVLEPPAGPAPAPAPADRRFAAPEWRSQPWFQYLVQSYLLAGQWLMDVVESVQLEAHAKRKIELVARHLVDAMSPANFPWSNPEALKLAAESGGETMARGMRHLAADTARGMISMSDEAAFELGRNLAVTPGAVVYQNELMQLIQYRPATATVYERPLVMVPPCINKYYILDLQPDNSLVRFALEQ